MIRKKGPYIKVELNGHVMTFSLGNSKLSSRTLIWNIAPGKDYSCRQNCAGCYALRDARRFPSVKRCWIRNFEAVKEDPRLIIHAINFVVKHYGHLFDQVRVHTAGEFFSIDYAKAWNAAAQMLLSNGKKVYTYTKNSDMIDFLGNINIVRSRLPIIGFNYGPAEKIERFAKHFDLPICPATQKHQGPIVCGDNCRTCINEQYVLFIQH